MFIKNALPDWLREYARWLRLRKKFPKVQIAQSAIISYDCSFVAPVVVHAHAQLQSSSVGRFTYCGLGSSIFDAEVGSFNSIANFATIGGGLHPAYDWISTSPAFYSTSKQAGSTFVSETRFPEHKQTTVGNDVWIGTKAVILPGLKIGNGAIIGAGAVVTKDVPDYAVVAGVPARILRFRFDPESIAWLLERKWWNENTEWLQKNAERFSHMSKLREN